MELSELDSLTVLMMRGYGDRLRLYSEVLNLFNDEFPDCINPITKGQGNEVPPQLMKIKD
ncbi:hypothetical protein J6590_092731 [Homalodisca vitripennis]|nr:hypothetical protein J6590_092731 [Homalodisca vitripennis]